MSRLSRWSQSANQSDEEKDGASFKNFMTTFGAVPVGGRNFFRLLQNKEAVLLFPGGVREVGLLPSIPPAPFLPRVDDGTLLRGPLLNQTPCGYKIIHKQP